MTEVTNQMIQAAVDAWADHVGRESTPVAAMSDITREGWRLAILAAIKVQRGLIDDPPAT